MCVVATTLFAPTAPAAALALAATLAGYGLHWIVVAGGALACIAATYLCGAWLAWRNAPTSGGPNESP